MLYNECNKVICIYECCRDCLLIIKIDICNKVDVAQFKCLAIDSISLYECWLDWHVYMNEDSDVMIVRMVRVYFSRVFLNYFPINKSGSTHIGYMDTCV